MSVDMHKQGKAFYGVPSASCRLRWEIWRNGLCIVFQSWSPNAVLKFSKEREKFNGNDEIIIRYLANVGGSDGVMLKVLNKDVEKIEYQHLITASSGNVFAGLRVHTLDGIFNCCTNGTVFREHS